ncbi:peroxiredoxin-like family protein [Actinomadura opuntiae]|uniref:peroxiredoxin-like family protein n=1 Tax=Actinomadura sp. OS1-43 TaxID=604315 RepID=UPI00255A995C|nr:peroxiredoxin-like family protein [Actinomadura sp. OS1-43]MDL4813973.1 peroxiredoxin-like family protein [Actinomadura sp. OS1-43]
MRLAPGSDVPARELTPVGGPPVPVPDPARLVHLQFRRFAGCPICNLHLRSFVVRHAEVEAAGIREVVVFHSPDEELRKHVTGLPFPVVGDPSKKLYAEFGVESGRRSLLDPRVWSPLVRAVLTGTWQTIRGREHLPSSSPAGGRLGLPGDFLIGPDGRVLAAKYGEHAYDQWSVDELLALAAQAPDPARKP